MSFVTTNAKKKRTFFRPHIVRENVKLYVFLFYQQIIIIDK